MASPSGGPTAATFRTYPHGVTCWVDTEQPDVDAAAAFYGGLFGWTFTDVLPPQAPGRYVVAALDGRDVAAIATGDPVSAAGVRSSTWSTYVAVDDVDATTTHLAGLGARVVAGPVDAGTGGRTATIHDLEGVELRLWQAGDQLGAQAVNEPGAWNFSDLHSSDLAAASSFYAAAFGWVIEDQGWSTSIRVPGYGDHLEAGVDPDIRTRQANAPEGFADVIGGIVAVGRGDAPHWHVSFTVADRDASVADVERLGGTVVATYENDWVRAAVVTDPQGATFTISQFAPTDWG